jgi:hypothetical protein
MGPFLQKQYAVGFVIGTIIVVRVTRPLSGQEPHRHRIRKHNRKRGPLAYSAFDINPSMMGLDNRIHNCKTKTGPFVLCRKERIEEPRTMCRINAGAGVTDHQTHRRSAE